MKEALLLLPLLALLANADDRWLVIRSGPFELLTNAGDRPARLVLNHLEQVRHITGVALGKEDLKTIWPVRILVRKTGQAAPLRWTRDTYTAALVAGAPVPPQLVRDCVRLLIEANARRMPPWIESGLETFLSTAQVEGTKITLGQPPAPAERNADWARMHMIVVDAATYGRLRVLLYNLQQGSDPDPAFRNALGKSKTEFDRQVGAYLAAGSFPTTLIGGRPLDPRRDFEPQPAEPPLPETALADAQRTRAAYLTLRNSAPAAAHEGLGFAALEEHKDDEARYEFGAAAEAGSKSARAWVELARLSNDKAHDALQKAVALNPAWAEPHVLLAAIEKDPGMQLNELKLASQLDPRSAARWRALAEFNLKHNRYLEAAKAWASAESASIDDAERESIREARRSIEQRRLDFEAAERKRIAEEKERNLQKVKDAAMAEVRAAEEKANRGAPPPPPDRKIVPLWEGPPPSGKLRGRLTQIECVRSTMRLVIENEEGKASRLLVRDPTRLLVIGSGAEATFACGAQKPARQVLVEYNPRVDSRTSVIGDAATVEYLGSDAHVAQPAPAEPERQVLKKK